MRAVSLGLPMVAALILCGACSGSGPKRAPIPPVLCMTLAPTNPPTSGTVVMQTGAASTCELAQLEIVATDVTDAFALRTTVEYNTATLAFVGMSTTGSALAQDGTQVNPLVTELILGELTIGVSRNAPTGIDINGSGKIATLFFVPLDTGMHDLNVMSPCLTDSQTPPVLQPGVPCSGGMTVVVQNP